MVRKHYAWTKARARCRRRRPKSPAPTNGWLLDELVELAETRASTVRYYVQKKLLRPIERRGTLTRYEKREFLRLLGLLRLKGDNTTTLEQKRRQLDSMGDAQLEQWLRSGPLPPKAAQALGLVAAPADPIPGSTAVDVNTANGRLGLEQWHRVTILPGLELMVRADAKEAARVVAQRIITDYVG